MFCNGCDIADEKMCSKCKYWKIIKTMDYKEKYEQALERAREFTENSVSTDPKCEYANEVLLKIFPELRESEDEKIRKEVKAYINRNYPVDSPVMAKSKILNWLEKQKPLSQDYDKAFDDFLDRIPEKEPESSNSCYDYDDLVAAIQFGIQWQKNQKPVEWSEEDDEKLKGICMYLMCSDSPEGYTEWIDWLKSLKPQPKQEWSEEDGILLYSIIKDLEQLKRESKIEQLSDIYDEEITWLESLKPQNRWKPSEEEINALTEVAFINESAVGKERKKVLEELIEKLKTLRDYE